MTPEQLQDDQYTPTNYDDAVAWLRHRGSTNPEEVAAISLGLSDGDDIINGQAFEAR